MIDSRATRASLLSRLRDVANAGDWREFHRCYGGLIRSVAKRAGLADAEIEDVVQETLISVARQLPEYHYDPARGSFKGWLLTITRRRLADHWRKVYREPAGEAPSAAATVFDESGLEVVWEEEWRQHLLTRALDRLGPRLRPQQRQVFQLGVVEGWPAAEVCQATGLSAAQAYLMKHRVGRMVKAEVAKLEAEEEG